VKHEDDLQLRWIIAAVRDLESRYPNVTSLGAASMALVGALQESHDSPAPTRTPSWRAWRRRSRYADFARSMTEAIAMVVWLLDWRETWEAFQTGTHLA
jgi:hypothetical protein